jgi:hypothetical protein
MENIPLDDSNLEESKQQPKQMFKTGLSETLNIKYPCLTTFIGSIVFLYAG